MVFSPFLTCEAFPPSYFFLKNRPILWGAQRGKRGEKRERKRGEGEERKEEEKGKEEREGGQLN
jgi:hypothetical protein